MQRGRGAQKVETKLRGECGLKLKSLQKAVLAGDANNLVGGQLTVPGGPSQRCRLQSPGRGPAGTPPRPPRAPRAPTRGRGGQRRAPHREEAGGGQEPEAPHSALKRRPRGSRGNTRAGCGVALTASRLRLTCQRAALGAPAGRARAPDRSRGAAAPPPAASPRRSSAPWVDNRRPGGDGRRAARLTWRGCPACPPGALRLRCAGEAGGRKQAPLCGEKCTAVGRWEKDQPRFQTVSRI